MHTIVNPGLWILSGLSLFVVAWVRFNRPPTNRAGTTFLLFYSGMVFYYALLMALWLLVILLLTGSGYGLNQIGAAVSRSLKGHQQLSGAAPVVAALIITIASQFKYVRGLDTAARSFCLALAAIPREADQLAIELAYSAEFRVLDPKLVKSISREITDNIGGNAVNFENDGSVPSRFTRAVALYWLFVVPSDSAALAFPTNASTRATYSRIIRLNEKIVEQSNKAYETMMEHALTYFSAGTRTPQTKTLLKRSMHDLSYLVCSVIARYVLYQNVTARQRRRRLSSMGFNAHDHLPAFGRDQWVASILAVIVLYSFFSIILPAHQSFQTALLSAVLSAVQLGIAMIAGTMVAQRFIRRDEGQGLRFPPLAELITSGLVVTGLCVAVGIGWPLIPSLLKTGVFGLSDAITVFSERWPFILLPFTCTLSIGLLCSYLGTSSLPIAKLAALGAIVNGLAFAMGGLLVGRLLPAEFFLQINPQLRVAHLMLIGMTAVVGTALGAIVLAAFPRSIRNAREVARIERHPTIDIADLPVLADLPMLEDPTSRAIAETGTATAATASRELGGYSRSNTEELEGRYVCFRPSFGNPDIINAYLVVIRWDEKRGHLIFEEQNRPDSGHTQNGCVYLPDGKPFVSLVTMDKGSVRLIMVARPDAGLSRGMIMTLSSPGGTHFIPTVAPIVLRRLGETLPQLGFIHRSDPDFGHYLAELGSVAPDFGLIANPPAAEARGPVRLSLVERAGG